METSGESIYPPDKIILAALSSKKISECSEIELDVEIASSIGIAFGYVGKKVDNSTENDIKFITRMLPGDLKRFVPNMRIKELSIAIKRGVFKEFGEYYGINVAELIRFCKSHYESDLRSNTAKSFLKPIETPQLMPSQETIFNLFKNNLLDAYSKHLNGGKYEANAPALYDFCNKLGLIIFSTAEKRDIMNDASKEIIRETELKLFVTVEDFHRKPLLRIKENITIPFEQLDKDLKIILINKSKKLTLSALFNEIHISEFNLSEMVENKKENFLIQ